MRFISPICGAARPMPGAAYIVSSMSAASCFTDASTSGISSATWRRRWSGSTRISRFAMEISAFQGSLAHIWYLRRGGQPAVDRPRTIRELVKLSRLGLPDGKALVLAWRFRRDGRDRSLCGGRGVRRAAGGVAGDLAALGARAVGRGRRPGRAGRGSAQEDRGGREDAGAPAAGAERDDGPNADDGGDLRLAHFGPGAAGQ